MTLNARAYTVLTMIALFAMAAIAAYQLVWPQPKSRYTGAEWKQRLRDIDNDIAVEQKQLNDAQAFVSRYVWDTGMDSITAYALDAVSSSAHAHKVQVVGFRPQKTGTVQGLVIAPYLVLLTGSFENVTAVLHDIEQPSHKLALEMVQYASADESTDTVNATVTVVAYQDPSAVTPVEKKDAAAKKK